MDLKFVTGNNNKIRELQQILNIKVEQFSLPVSEIQAIEVDSVIKSKAEQAYQQAISPVLVEDTGLAFVAWNNLPGALIKWFMESVGSEGICRMLRGEDNRQAIAKCTFDFYDGTKHHLFSGSLRGTIAHSPRGKNGFGWDDIFIPEGHNKTFAEMTDEEKNRISMRRKALDKLQRFLGDSVPLSFS